MPGCSEEHDTVDIGSGGGVSGGGRAVGVGAGPGGSSEVVDAGQYQQAIPAAASAQDPRLIYLAAQSQQKLRHQDERAAVRQLAGQGEGDAWRDIGRSAVALLASDAGAAGDAATQAVMRGDSLPEAHYQLGLALASGRT